MLLELIEAETNIITLSIGRNYLYDIANEYVDKEEITEVHRRIDVFVNSIEDKKSLNKFSLPRPVYNFFYSKRADELFDKLVEGLDSKKSDIEERFLYNHLLHHIRNCYKEFLSDKKLGKIHLYLNLEPKEPTTYNPIDDVLPNYKDIMCKFYLSRYKKYTERLQNSSEGWTYQLCMMYLIIIGNLFKILQPYITSVDDFIYRCMSILNPINTGFTATTSFDLGDTKAYSVLYELAQLTSSGKHLQIRSEKKLPSVEFLFTTLGSRFHYSLDEASASAYEGDNLGKRLAKLTVYGSGNIINFRMDFIGLGVIEDVTGMAVLKDFYSLITDETELEVITYRTIKYMLSNTKTFKDVSVSADEVAPSLYNKKKWYHPFCSDKNFKKFKIKAIRDELLHSNAFTKLKSENKLLLADRLIKEFNLKKYQMDYIIIAIELAKFEPEIISEKIKSLGSKQQAQIRKMIKYIKELNLQAPKPLVNQLFRKVCYKN